jgi:cell division protein FtsB
MSGSTRTVFCAILVFGAEALFAQTAPSTQPQTDLERKVRQLQARVEFLEDTIAALEQELQELRPSPASRDAASTKPSPIGPGDFPYRPAWKRPAPHTPTPQRRSGS